MPEAPPLGVEARVELVAADAAAAAAVVARRLRVGAPGHHVERVDVHRVVAGAVVLAEQADPEAAGLVQVLLDRDRRAERGECRPVRRRPGRDLPGIRVVDEPDPDVVAGQVERAGVRPRDGGGRDDDRVAVRGHTRSAHLPGWSPGVFGIGVALVLERGLDEVVRVEAVDQRQPGRLAVGVDLGVRDLRRRHPRVRGRLLEDHLRRPVAAEQVAGDERQRQVAVRHRRPLGGVRVDELPLRVELGALELVRERVALVRALVRREPDVLVGRRDLAVHAERRRCRRARPRLANSSATLMLTSQVGPLRAVAAELRVHRVARPRHAQVVGRQVLREPAASPMRVPSVRAPSFSFLTSKYVPLLVLPLSPLRVW